MNESENNVSAEMLWSSFMEAPTINPNTSHQYYLSDLELNSISIFPKQNTHFFNIVCIFKEKQTHYKTHILLMIICKGK